MTTKPVLTTPRLRLRAVTIEDAPALVALDADPEVRRFVDLPLAPTLQQITGDMIPRWQAYDAKTPELGFWVATMAGEMDVIGWFHLRPPKQHGPLRGDDLELGYRFCRACWGQGLATEGSRALLRYAFDQLGAPRIAASSLAANAASIRVMQKLGLVLDSHWLYKDSIPAVCYAISSEQWRAGQALRSAPPSFH